MRCAALVAAPLILAACSSTSTSTAQPGSTSRFAGLFATAPVAAPPATNVTAFNPDDCPQVDTRTGAASLTVSDKSSEGTAADVRYELSLNQLARQCTLLDGNLVMKIGVQGRIVLGPAGAPGPVDVPLRFAVIQEGIEQKTIATKFKRVSADVPTGQDNVIFSDVDDDLSFPMPSRAELASYRAYVGFDEMGDTPAKKPAAKKPAAKRKQ
ncbi:MAG TPA: hypothetical protein VKW08_04120 [Xanthobacteraceae bacterium]|nr:hypothetical protein [Xanthobacteraceae bacterium]